MGNMKRVIECLVLATCFLRHALAEDWPEWPGKGGYAGPAVAAGRVFVTDFQRSVGMTGTERALCLDEKTGKVLWKCQWNADYKGIDVLTSHTVNAK
jgi:outer membrane protein assembly factor BamB